MIRRMDFNCDGCVDEYEFERFLIKINRPDDAAPI